MSHATGKTVLVVDDNHGTTALLALLLGERGHDVRRAHDGRSALAEVARSDPAVVFLDLGLPDLDGFEVARRIRAADDGAPRCLVALTGYTDTQTPAQARAAGFDDVALKPTDLDALGESLDRFL